MLLGGWTYFFPPSDSMAEDLTYRKSPGFFFSDPS